MEHKKDHNLYREPVSRMGHGGDVYNNDVALDFSISTNPCADMLWKAAFTGDSQYVDGMPVLRKYADHFRQVKEAAMRGLQMAVRYPDPECTKLRNEISLLEQTDPASIICGNGASELFMALVRAVNPKKALVLAPCYSGYEYVLRSAGCEISKYKLKEENGFMPQEDLQDELAEDIDIFFLAQPNNPTGRLAEPSLLERIGQTCRDKKILLVTDACFYPLAADEPLSYPGNGIVVKAFTKTMAVPGLRLGYLMTGDMELKAEIERQLSEWSVSSVAQEVGCATARFFAETDFLKESRQYIRQEREWLAKTLEDMGLIVYDSDTNYLLIKGTPGLWAQLIAKKTLVRSCANFDGLGPEYIRIAVKTHKDDQALAGQIASALEIEVNK